MSNHGSTSKENLPRSLYGSHRPCLDMRVFVWTSWVLVRTKYRERSRRLTSNANDSLTVHQILLPSKNLTVPLTWLYRNLRAGTRYMYVRDLITSRVGHVDSLRRGKSCDLFTSLDPKLIIGFGFHRTVYTYFLRHGFFLCIIDYMTSFPDFLIVTRPGSTKYLSWTSTR